MSSLTTSMRSMSSCARYPVVRCSVFMDSVCFPCIGSGGFANTEGWLVRIYVCKKASGNLIGSLRRVAGCELQPTLIPNIIYWQNWPKRSRASCKFHVICKTSCFKVRCTLDEVSLHLKTLVRKVQSSLKQRLGRQKYLKPPRMEGNSMDFPGHLVIY